MLKGSLYQGYDSKLKRTGGLRSPTNMPLTTQKSKELRMSVSSKNFGKLKRRSVGPSPGIDSFKAKLCGGPAVTKHLKSRSIVEIEDVELDQRLKAKICSLSSSIRSPREVDFKGPQRLSRVDAICKDLTVKLIRLSPIDVINRSIEAIKALKLLGETDQDLSSLIMVAAHELDDGVAARLVMDRKLEQLSRENYNLSKQLEATEEKNTQAATYDLVNLENLTLKAKLDELKAKLKAHGLTDDYTPHPQSSLKSASTEKSSA